MSQFNVNTIADEPGTGGPDFVGMPSVGGDPVVESGGNSDGRWVKFADGTLICQKTGHMSSATGYTTWVYPVAEVSGLRGLFGYTNTSQFNDVYITTFGNPVNTEVPVQVTRVIVTTDEITHQSVGSNLFLIGRWK